MSSIFILKHTISCKPLNFWSKQFNFLYYMFIVCYLKIKKTQLSKIRRSRRSGPNQFFPHITIFDLGIEHSRVFQVYIQFFRIACVNHECKNRFSFRIAPLQKVSINEKFLFIRRYQNYIINLSLTFWTCCCCFNSPGELEFGQIIGKKISKNQIKFKKLGVASQRKNPTNGKILS